MFMKTPVKALTAAAIVGGMAILSGGSSNLAGVIFMTPFSLGPLFVTLSLAFKAESLLSQRLLLASTVAYSSWFAFAYLDAFVWHLDPQSALVLLFVGIYSLPVMLPLWVIAWWKRKNRITLPVTTDP